MYHIYYWVVRMLGSYAGLLTCWVATKTEMITAKMAAFRIMKSRVMQQYMQCNVVQFPFRNYDPFYYVCRVKQHWGRICSVCSSS